MTRVEYVLSYHAISAQRMWVGFKNCLHNSLVMAHRFDANFEVPLELRHIFGIQLTNQKSQKTEITLQNLQYLAKLIHRVFAIINPIVK